jgi:hypothetical protein
MTMYDQRQGISPDDQRLVASAENDNVLSGKESPKARSFNIIHRDFWKDRIPMGWDAGGGKLSWYPFIQLKGRGV